MVIKRKEIVDITPDPWETKKNTNSKKRNKITQEKEEEEEEDGTPLRAIFCLKTRQDMKVFEEKEDCFILDFDPNDSFDIKKLSDSHEGDKENELTVIHEKGQVACRDFPHPRHHCSRFPFGTTHHPTHCKQCYCYVCDLAAPCAQWILHCDASDNSSWKPLRDWHRNLRAQSVATSNK